MVGRMVCGKFSTGDYCANALVRLKVLIQSVLIEAKPISGCRKFLLISMGGQVMSLPGADKGREDQNQCERFVSLLIF